MNKVDEELLQEITQQSTEMWMQTEDRLNPYASPVVICRNPERSYYLHRTEGKSGLPIINGWRVEERPLRIADASEFFAAFGSHWSYLLNSIFRDLPIRAFIKNGRSRKWMISQNVAASDAIGKLAESLDVFQANIEQATEA